VKPTVLPCGLLIVVASAWLVGTASGEQSKEQALRSLMPLGAFDVHEGNEGETKTHLTYKKIVKFPETALAHEGRKALAREGWKTCKGIRSGWQTYPEIKNGRSFKNYTRIEYFTKEDHILRLAFYYRLDQASGSSTPNDKIPQTVSIERFAAIGDSTAEVRRALKELGYDCTI
jgi:hypothetical protein